jgi:hypothetical protein
VLLLAYRHPCSNLVTSAYLKDKPCKWPQKHVYGRKRGLGAAKKVSAQPIWPSGAPKRRLVALQVRFGARKEAKEIFTSLGPLSSKAALKVGRAMLKSEL